MAKKKSSGPSPSKFKPTPDGGEVRVRPGNHGKSFHPQLETFNDNSEWVENKSKRRDLQ